MGLRPYGHGDCCKIVGIRGKATGRRELGDARTPGDMITVQGRNPKPNYSLLHLSPLRLQPMASVWMWRVRGFVGSGNVFQLGQPTYV